MSKKTPRSYVSGHVYRTPTGLYYDDRNGKRLTARRGAATERASQRMNARVRDEDGKLSFKRIKVSSDIRKSGEKHRGSPDSTEAEVDVSYDPNINVELAEENALKRLDQEDSEYAHFNVSYIEDVEE